MRIKAGRYRDKFEHRVVIEDVINGGVSFPPGFTKGGGIPIGFEIHHFDANRSHNCVNNLMLLQECIHHAIEKSKRAHLPWYEKHLRKVGLRPTRKRP